MPGHYSGILYADKTGITYEKLIQWGVGKTTVCRELNKILDNSIFLDGDRCRDMDPFVVTDETKEMVTDNICYLPDIS